MKPIPHGTYELMSGKLDAPLADQPALNNPSIDGIRLKARWSDIEVTPGIYNWSNLDSAINQVTIKGKKCGISVNAGIDCPAWLYQPPFNAIPYILQDTGGNEGETIPKPGDAIFIKRYTKFIKSLGQRYNQNNTVSYITICGIGNHDESNIAGGPIDTANLGTPEGVELWKSMSKTFIDVYALAFPTTTIFMVLAKPFSNSLGNPAMIEVSDHGVSNYTPRFGLAFNALSANVNQNYEPVHQILLHWQTNPTWAQFLQAHGSLGIPLSEGVDQSLRMALVLKIRGAEIYKSDSENNTIFSYTAPANAIFQGQSVAGTPAGITPRRSEMLAIPLP